MSALLIVLPITSLGCWKDYTDRAIANGFHGTLGIQGCFERAKLLGYQVFAVQYGGECYTSSEAAETYNKYGSCDICEGGAGGIWCQDVYQINGNLDISYVANLFSKYHFISSKMSYFVTLN